MKRAIAFANRWCLTLLLSACFLSAAQAQKNEFAVSASGLLTSASFNTSSSAGFQINYARRLIPLPLISLYLELPFEAGFNGSRTSGPSLNREDYNTLYFTPGLKVKFAPGFPVSPYLAGGLGWGSFRSTNTSATANKFAADLGGGVDFKVFPYISLRGEVRDYWTGAPTLDFPGIYHGNVNNIVLSGGAVFRF
jgi:opacity protein-like surface antigen